MRLPARLLRLASDERLVDVLRGGSEAAFEVLYTRHHRGVLSFCRHMLGSVEEAEDAVQHTFLAAYRDLLRSQKPVQLRPWLYTIARNRCLSVLRARRERISDEPIEPSTEHLAQQVERQQDLRALLADMAELPHDQRAALVLAELGDMSHDEIGDVLECPREKVKALVFQARSSLIASRKARETPCAEVREQLANLRGGALRRNTLRRHLRECPGCREFRDQVMEQRSALALILPVAPTLGLKATVLGAAGVTAAAGGGSAVVATGVVAVCLAGGGAAAVDVARDDPGSRARSSEPRPARTVPAAAAPAAPQSGPEVVPAGKAEERRGPKEGRPRRATLAPGRQADSRTGNGNESAARPPRAQGPKPKAARPVRGKSRATKPVTFEAPKAKVPEPGGSHRASPEKPDKAVADAPGPPVAPPVDPPDSPPIEPQDAHPVDPPDAPPVELPAQATERRDGP